MSIRPIPTAESLDQLSDRKQWVIAHQLDVARGDHQFSWVPTIDADDYRAILGSASKPGLREQGIYGTAQRRMLEGSRVGNNRAFFELVCWRVASSKKI